jgi:hypothetical protein
MRTGRRQVAYAPYRYANKKEHIPLERTSADTSTSEQSESKQVPLKVLIAPLTKNGGVEFLVHNHTAQASAGSIWRSADKLSPTLLV